MPAQSKQDIPVIIHNGKRGLLSIEDGSLDVLQLSSDGRPPKQLLSAPVRLLLRARLGPPSATPPPTSATGTPRSSFARNSTSRRSSSITSFGKSKPQPASGTRKLDIHALVQKGANSSHLHYTKIRVLVEPSHVADAEQWVDELMKAAYPVSKPYRNVLLIVNPVGGKGKATSIVKQTVLPILEAAGCHVDMRETTHRYHAEEICRSIDLSEFDVIAVASGDGSLYEVLNGLAGRQDARKALRTPIAPLPTGSACACCTNLFGPKDTFNVPLATLNIVKGQPMSIDLQSVLLLPSRERRVSFLSVALGLMVDLDIGTESYRWMGDARFVYGFLRGIVQRKPCKARVWLDVVGDNKEEMAVKARSVAAKERGTRTVGGGTDPLALIRGVQKLAVDDRTDASANGNGYGHAAMPGGNGVAMPADSRSASADAFGSSGPSSEPGASSPMRNGEVDPRKPSDATDSSYATDVGLFDKVDDGPLPHAKELVPTDSWMTLVSDKKGVRPTVRKNAWTEGDQMLYLYSGLMPWVSRDLNQWPVAQAGGGVIDIVMQRVVSRNVLVSGIAGAPNGDPYWEDSQLYLKVRGYVVENLDKKAQEYTTIDGEAYKWDTLHVEVLPRAATLLSLDGRFVHSVFVLKDGKGK